MKAVEREAILLKVRSEITKSGYFWSACVCNGISTATYKRWSERYAQGGVEALADRPRSGRPRKNKGAVA